MKKIKVPAAKPRRRSAMTAGLRGALNEAGIAAAARRHNSAVASDIIRQRQTRRSCLGR